MKRLLAISLMLSVGCGTMSHGPMETIRVESNPAGADASIRCDQGVNVSGTTPVSLTIPRRVDGCIVRVSKAGYEEKSVPLVQGMSGKYWSNFALVGAVPAGVAAGFASGSYEMLFAGLLVGVAGGVGFLVDHAKGAKNDREVHEVHVDLATNPAN